jgi:hypothetical protein
VKTLSGITSAVGVATLLFAGYVFLKAIPDMGRYIRISRNVKAGWFMEDPKAVRLWNHPKLGL